MTGKQSSENDFSMLQKRTKREGMPILGTEDRNNFGQRWADMGGAHRREVATNNHRSGANRFDIVPMAGWFSSKHQKSVEIQRGMKMLSS